MTQNNQLLEILTSAKEQLTGGVDPEQIRQEVLGRKGSLTAILRTLGTLEGDERAHLGKESNEVKNEIEELLSDHTTGQTTAESFDPSVPPYPQKFGSIHPISVIIEELVGIFEDLSFEIVEGNELVGEYENFDSLNITKDHPARDSHDTFFIDQDLLLRTHTSTVQVQEMRRRNENKELPIRFVVPGKAYRRDSDATHSPMFHQLEGVMVDTQTTFADLKGILDHVAKRLFGDKVETRFRTHFFPFTEPSAEMDIRWKNATGEGKHTQWIEWLGCGMIHPKVLEHAGINPKVYQGWAFGGGIERPVMIRHQVPDLRKFFDNSVEFLDQFGDTL